MKILSVLFLCLLTACGDPCAPRQDCVRGHYESEVSWIWMGDAWFMPIVVDVWHCDEYGPVYKPEGCR